ncbi:MAG: hypothetical protein V4629_11930 [Pseudomonadota bacterium]
MINGVITFLLLIIFLSICWWVFIRKSAEDFNEVAKLPLEENKDKHLNSEEKTSKKDSN